MSAKLLSDTARQFSSKYYGVDWHKKTQKWRAHIVSKGTKIHLGLFVTEEDAALAYDKAVLQAVAEVSNPEKDML
jgi:hypothetical protein